MPENFAIDLEETAGTVGTRVQRGRDCLQFECSFVDLSNYVRVPMLVGELI